MFFAMKHCAVVQSMVQRHAEGLGVTRLAVLYETMVGMHEGQFRRQDPIVPQDNFLVFSSRVLDDRRASGKQTPINILPLMGVLAQATFYVWPIEAAFASIRRVVAEENNPTPTDTVLVILSQIILSANHVWKIQSRVIYQLLTTLTAQRYHDKDCRDVTIEVSAF
jgi:hypothetical protein